MAEAAILRVRHCGAAIFCRRPPSRCPACGRPLRGAGLPAAPVRLPSPFRHGHRQPRAFLLRPAAGTFLGGYDGESDLHVGITSTHGKKRSPAASHTAARLPCLVFPTALPPFRAARDYLNRPAGVSEPPPPLRQYPVPVKNAGGNVPTPGALLPRCRSRSWAARYGRVTT
ncbi:MKRN2 opposite strand protein isoform X4 [Aquila chrysaetos chrysaetos]|uniref:MKRN2 opposite strand protein isoform X4 n=1 Tax=Aquila chrysaetos chrysaetos TaxID=223781 RepID=UPI001B7D4410|nr:MKRN2 opposite strand protein isoform X4 [Aquila chrysaetos chrysaetos]